MNLTETRRAMVELGIRPSKALGQNFLIDANITRIILDAADFSPRDTVLEIGAGLGVLTEKIVERAERVVSVERDERLAKFLQKRMKGAKNLELHHADALALDFRKLGLRDLQFKLIANLPYSVGTQLLLRFVEDGPRPSRIIVTVQREVAERLTALPRSKDYGAASVLAQLFYALHIVHRIAPTCFWPSPKVESAILQMDWFPHPKLKLSRATKVVRLAHAGFAQRRKMLRRLWSEDILRVAGIASTARAEEVSVEQWIRLAQR